MPTYNNRTKLSDEDFIKQFKQETRRDLKDKDHDALDDILVGNEFQDDLKRQMIRFSKVVKEIPNCSTADYIRAVYFCSLYAQGLSQEASYRKVFPERVAKKRQDTSTVSNSANSYFHSMLVQAIWKQVNVTDHMMFVDKRFKAYAVLEDIMDDEDSSKKEKIEAASKLANLLKPPKEALVRVDVGYQGKEMKALEEKLASMANHQIDMMTKGQITNKDIVEAEIVDKEDEEFDPEIHDVEVYEKYQLIVKRID